VRLQLADPAIILIISRHVWSDGGLAGTSIFPPPLLTWLTENSEGCVASSLGAGANSNVKLARINNPALGSSAPVLQRDFVKTEAEDAEFAKLQGYPLEALELAHPTQRAAGLLVNVQLHHLVASSASGVVANSKPRQSQEL